MRARPGACAINSGRGFSIRALLGVEHAPSVESFRL
jgi:hypothetical protein